MNMRFWSSLILSILVVAGCLSLPLISQTLVPFETKPGADRLHPLIVPSSIGLPLPPGLQTGDVLDFPDLSVRTRLMFNGSAGNQPAGSVADLVIIRDGQKLQVPVTIVEDHKTGENLAVFIAAIALTWLFAGLGLLLLWRGQRQAAWAVCLWCLLNVFDSVITNLNLPLLLQVCLGAAMNDLAAAGTLVALYLLADDLTKAGITHNVRRTLRYAFIAVVVSYAIANPAANAYVLLTATFIGVFFAVFPLHLIGFGIPLALLTLFYRHAQPADRPRIRWVSVSIFIYVLSYLVGTNLLSIAGLLNGLQTALLVTLLTALAFLGLTYAVLRHRLVSLRLVLNRTLVYGVITSLVVGVFAALSSLIEHFAVGRTEGALLQLLVPLSLGVTLNLIKKRLDGFVERLFFQRQYRAETALNRFIRECGFIEDRDALLERTTSEILEYLKPTGIALYERGDSGYLLARQAGERTFPKKLAGDDPAMVSLRASLTEADLDTLASGLGKAGLAFPLAVRGVLIGALILGQRPAEQYTQGERALLARIGQQVAAALHALRARDAESFVDAVARGELTASPKTKSRARQLLQQNLAA